MADAKKTEAAAEGDADVPKKKSKKLLIIVVAVVLILVLGGGGAAFFLMKKKAVAEDDEGDGPPAKVAKDKKKKDAHGAPPAFAKLDPFVVKLQVEANDAYVQAVPELKLQDAHVSDQIKAFMPEIRHKVLMILAGKKASELNAPAGMQLLANQIRVSINATLAGEKPDAAKEKLDQDDEAPVQAVFFSSLIVQ